MNASLTGLAPRPTRAKNSQRRRRAQRREQRQRVLRERVAYMLWVMANGVD